jgi:hypothetical protein
MERYFLDNGIILCQNRSLKAILWWPLIILPAISMLLTACMPTTNLQVIELPVISIPKNIDTVAVVNRFLSLDKNTNVNNSSTTFPFEDEKVFNKQASDSCVSTLLKMIRKSPFLKEIDIKQQLYRTGNDFYAPPLLPDQVKDLCKTYKIHGLVVIDGFYTNPSISTQVRSKEVPITEKYELRGRTYSRTNYVTELMYDATLQVSYSIGLRLYQASDGNVIDEFRYDNYIYDKKTARSVSEAEALLPDKIKIIEQIANTSAPVYVRRIAPTWGTVKRSYYSTPGKSLAKAHKCITQNNWSEAQNIWQNLYNTTGSPSRKGLAAYNLAVAYEMKNNFDSAFVWINKAKDIFTTREIPDLLKTTKKYIAVLNGRLVDKQKIEEQIAK